MVVVIAWLVVYFLSKAHLKVCGVKVMREFCEWVLQCWYGAEMLLVGVVMLIIW
jgi:hypothetical protein